jgi:hypothetical protein
MGRETNLEASRSVTSHRGVGNTFETPIHVVVKAVYKHQDNKRGDITLLSPM